MRNKSTWQYRSLKILIQISGKIFLCYILDNEIYILPQKILFYSLLLPLVETECYRKFNDYLCQIKYNILVIKKIIGLSDNYKNYRRPNILGDHVPFYILK